MASITGYSPGIADQILAILERNEQAIQDSKQILVDIEQNIIDNEPHLHCCYMESTPDVNSRFPSLDLNEDNNSDFDRLLQLLELELHEIILSEDRAIPAESNFADLLKILYDKLAVEFDIDNLTPEQLHNFVRSQEDLIMDFINQRCRRKIFECLKDEFERSKIRMNCVAEISAEQNEVIEPINSIASKDNAVVKEDVIKERRYTTSSGMKIFEPAESVHLKRSNSDEALEGAFTIYNKLQDAQYEGILKDQLNGLEEVNKRIDSPRSLFKSLTSPENSIDKGYQPKSSLSRLFEKYHQKSMDDSVYTPDAELIIALDKAISELEHKVRARIYKKFDPEGEYIEDLDEDRDSISDVMDEFEAERKMASKISRISRYSVLKSLGI